MVLRQFAQATFLFLLCSWITASQLYAQCTNPADGGTIAGNQTICAGADPDALTDSTLPTGHSGTLEYKWQHSVTSSSSGFSDIESSNSVVYDPPALSQTTWYRRLARVDCETDWSGAAESNVLEVFVSQPRRFVTFNGAGINDGSSWNNAHNASQLQDAIDGLCVDEVWVAAGTYTPTKEIGGTGNLFNTFQLKNGVAVYGCFEGNEDPEAFDLDDRDFEANETILSGDLGSGVHVYHVFRHVDIGLNSTAILDGFTLSGGKADGSDDENKGGGMLNIGSSSGNGSSPTIRNCVFHNNTATEGGAIYNSRYSSPVVSYTTFSNNTASTKGGAVFNTRNTPVFNNCNFSSNEVTGSAASDGGGAIYNNTQNAAEGPVITLCIFNNNTVPTTGTATYGGGAIFSIINPGKLEISYSTFTGNAGKYGGAVYHSSGSDVNRDDSEVQINNSSFEENNAEYGGAIFSDRHNAIVTSCLIRGNEATEQSGGFYGRNGSSQLINSQISGNKSGKHGGGVYFNQETPEVINTTITGNYSGERGGGISMIGGSTVELKNSITWGNASPEGNELWVCATCTANIDYSLYGNATGDVFITSGGVVNATNSLNVNPVFLDSYDPPTNSNTPNILGNYFICGCTSPCIDAGLNSHVPSGITEDLRGTGRFLDGNDDGNAIVDLGAYEFDPDGCNALAPFAGDGSAGNPYEISMLQHLYWVAVDPARWVYHYIQTADIDACNTGTWFSGQGWTPIGNSSIKFTGTYNGQEHIISNLVINRPATNNVGLFGVIDGQSTQKVVLQNITLVNADITGNREVGALVGLADQFNEITNCHVSGIVNGNRTIGGLVGWGRRTDFLQCSSSADVSVIDPSGALYHGGLVGHINSTSTVKESFATGNVSGRGRVGGLIGAMGWDSNVENSYARGNVQSDINNPMIGGLIGEVWNAGVRNSYSTGVVNMEGVTSEYGGLVGSKTTNSNYFDENNLWDTETSSLNISEMGVGKTTSEMKTQSTFTNWDFTEIWNLEDDKNDNYPYLRWQTFPNTVSSTWNGLISTDWNTGSNWDPTGVPTSAISVIIPNAAITPYSPLLPISAVCKSVQIESGGVLNAAASGGILSLSGADIVWHVATGGTFNANTGTVEITSMEGNNSIDGTTSFHNLKIAAGTTLQPSTDSYTGISGVLTIDGILSGNTNKNVVEFNGTDQNIPNPVGSNYHSLIIGGSGTKTFPANLYIAGNLTNNGTIDAVTNSNTVIMNGVEHGLNQIMDGTTTTLFNNLTIQNGSTTIIRSPQKASGNILVDGILHSDGFLTLVSTASKTALVVGTGTGQISGNVTMERYLPSGMGYKYISSPFQSATVGELSPEIDLTSSTTLVYRYDENRNFQGTPLSGWVNYKLTTNVLYPLVGYAVNIGNDDAPITLDITGIVNNGPLSIAVSNNNNPYTNGFNLVGNPYPSPIDWDAPFGWTRTNIDDALYFFIAGTIDQYEGSYSTYINGIKSDGSVSNIIPSMQGFFVHVKDGEYPVAGSLQMNNDVRVINQTQSYIKGNKADKAVKGTPVIRLTASFSDNTPFPDYAVAYFDPKSTPEFDGQLDALKLMNSDINVPNFYFVTPGDINLQIQALLPVLDTICKVPLGITIKRDGYVIIKIRDIDPEFSNLRISITDMVKGTEQDLLSNQEFKIFLNAGEYKNRFFLNITDLATTIPEKPENEEIFNIYYSHNSLHATINQFHGSDATLTIYNLLGQTLLTEAIRAEGYHIVNAQLKDGIYIATYVTGNIRTSKKISIRNK